jgi:hypothetical protein
MKLQRQWVVLDNSLIFLGLHFVIGQRELTFALAQMSNHMLTLLWSVFSICQLSTCNVSTSVLEPTLV